MDHSQNTPYDQPDLIGEAATHFPVKRISQDLELPELYKGNKGIANLKGQVKWPIIKIFTAINAGYRLP